jgi:putative ABC transport system substrate-binding protein
LQIFIAPAELAADDPEAQARNAAFLQALQELGWTAGRNLQIEYRWGGEIADRNREYAAELIALAPEVIVSGGGSPGLAALRRATYGADRIRGHR